MKHRIVIPLILVAVFSACSSAKDTPSDIRESVFVLVRHAEKVDESEDSPLTELGQRRAETLANMLRDSGIGTIYSSDFVRTRNTASPLSQELRVSVSIYDHHRLNDFAKELLDSPGRYLIVGHRDTTPELVRLLGGDPGSEIETGEYDRLYLLVKRPGDGTSTVLLRFEP